VRKNRKRPLRDKRNEDLTIANLPVTEVASEGLAFANPPVMEVALSVQFDPIAGLRAAHLGHWWYTDLKPDFPTIDEQAALPATVETFDEPEAPQNRIEVRVSGPMRISGSFVDPHAWSTNRSWFLTKSGDRIIQVQPDRLVVNWRRANEGSDYPRYSGLRKLFEKTLRNFKAFLDRENLGTVKPIQCELTYVNHLVAGNGWEKFSDIDRLFVGCNPAIEGLPEVDDAAFQFRYLILGTQNQRIGRVHVSVQPAFRSSDKRRIFIFQIVGRGKPEEEGNEGAVGFLDKAHYLACRSFVSLTSSPMHKIWKLL